MTHEECRQTLGVPPDATAETIRQAYLDLARVWHPDRFQSDERLRRIAQEHLREINEAWSILRSSRPAAAGPAAQAQAAAGSRPDTRSATAAATEEPPPANPWRPSPAPSWTHPRPFRSSISVTPWLRLLSNKAAYTATLVVLLAVPFFAVSKLVGLIRVPTPGTNLIASPTFPLRIPSPMQVVDPNSDARDAVDALSYWIRSEAGDLWKAPRNHPPESTVSVTAAAGDDRKPAARTSLLDRKQLKPAVPHQPPPNGAELIANLRQSGVGELRVSNHTGLEAVFKLVKDRRVLRAVYVAPQGSVTLRSIPIGVYDLHVDLGKDLDVDRLQFLSDRKTLVEGPFQFIEITSEKGTSGKYFEVVVNPP